MTWKNRKRLAMVRIQLRKTLKYLLHVGFTGRARSQSALRALSLSAVKPPEPKRVACFVYLRQAGPGANPRSGLFPYLQPSRPRRSALLVSSISAKQSPEPIHAPVFFFYLS